MSSNHQATVELVVSEFIVLAVVCLFLVHHYKNPLVTFDVSVTVYLSWVLGFTGILLLPYDISLSVIKSEDGVVQSSETELHAVWNFIYWRYNFDSYYFQSHQYIYVFLINIYVKI